jgi:hypothetical protein
MAASVRVAELPKESTSITKATSIRAKSIGPWMMLLCRSCHSGGHQFDAAKDTKDVINAAVLQLAGSHRAAMSGTSKQNKNYDPRTMMNLKMYGDIRGYQGENDDGL